MDHPPLAQDSDPQRDSNISNDAIERETIRILCEESTGLTVLKAGSLCLILLGSVLANGLVFVVFYRRRNLLNVSNRFLLNLALCNFLMAVLVMPFVLMSSITSDWPLGDTFCDILGTTTILLFIACILTLLLISVDRYYAVMKPLHYTMKFTSRRSVILIGVVWGMALLLAVPPVFGWGHVTFQPGKKLCFVNWASRVPMDRAYSYSLVCACFVVPFLVMSWVYVMVLRAAQRTSARARRNSLTPDSVDSHGCGVTQHMLQQRRNSSSASLLHTLVIMSLMQRRGSAGSRSNSILGLHRDDWKAAKTGLIVMSTFVVCWLPVFITIVIEASVMDGEVVPAWFQGGAVWVALSGCAINPLVYVFRSTPIREEVRRMFRLGQDSETVERRRSSGSLQSGSPSGFKVRTPSTTCPPHTLLQMLEADKPTSSLAKCPSPVWEDPHNERDSKSSEDDARCC